MWDEVEQSVIDDGIDYSVADMGGATDFKVGGTKQDSRAERAKKKFVPPTFPNVGGTSKQISVGTY